MSNFYTYLYQNPLKDNEPFYIGEGCNDRWKDHLNEAKKLITQKKSNRWIMENCSNPHKLFTIINILKADLEPILVKVLENVNKQSAINEEIKLIAHYGRKDKGHGTLTNMTDGGGGNGNRIDLTGQKFNMLTVLEHAENRKWLCRCECGNEKVMLSTSFKSGKSKSCGCQHGTHGKTKTKTYRTWINIRIWCYKVSHAAYEYYGGRGITVCKRWKNSFENFLEDMGDKPSENHSLIRADKSKGYSKDNCEWVLK